MEYAQVVTGKFLQRPNRFVALCEIEGRTHRCHVKNTGRCRELLLPGATVFLQDRRGAEKPGKTEFSLIGVKKGDMLVNIDSQAPNAVVKEALLSGALVLPGFACPDIVRPEYGYGASRLDFYLQKGDRRALVEVKGVTLEVGGQARSRFPDAPTQRGVKHLDELAGAVAAGYSCFAVFVIALRPVSSMAPNWLTHPAFGRALQRAQKAGVQLLAYDCAVGQDTLSLGRPVPIDLHTPASAEDGF